MIIDFDKEKEQILPAFKGGEGEYIARIVSDDLNKVMYGKLEPGSSIGYHTHDTNSEIIYVISGKGTVLYDESEENVELGNCHYCKKGHGHSLINNSSEDLLFFAVVTEQ